MTLFLFIKFIIFFNITFFTLYMYEIYKVWKFWLTQETGIPGVDDDVVVDSVHGSIVANMKVYVVHIYIMYFHNRCDFCLSSEGWNKTMRCSSRCRYGVLPSAHWMTACTASHTMIIIFKILLIHSQRILASLFSHHALVVLIRFLSSIDWFPGLTRLLPDLRCLSIVFHNEVEILSHPP